ncbi:hypothetical protein [Salmonella sp. 32070601201500089SM]|uniref:hypothetical protein n=1 Tax=Salmonella sp. 32070601201500089SM TaxID=2819686 RepID=UPI001AAFCCCD|nr:hypothetical protein [Salmonella sp. 32070601201500089SM]MBO2431505.1 hypothetical protein [Salmonella sp. 32070601201500089SM]
MKKNIRDHDIEGQYRTVSNPYIAVPLTAIFKKELVRKYGLFFHIKPPYRGDENTRPGFDTKTPGAFLNRACSGPEGARPRDGLSSGAASWTDDEPARRQPEGASKASQSPLTAIFKKELVRKYGLLYLNFLFLL